MVLVKQSLTLVFYSLKPVSEAGHQRKLGVTCFLSSGQLDPGGLTLPTPRVKCGDLVCAECSLPPARGVLGLQAGCAAHGALRL